MSTQLSSKSKVRSTRNRNISANIRKNNKIIEDQENSDTRNSFAEDEFEKVTNIKLDLFDESSFKPKPDKIQVNKIKYKVLEKEHLLPKIVMEKSLISLMSREEMQRIAPVRITNSKLKGIGSVNDPLMGAISMTDPCQNCGKIDCPGHYGYIDFGVPVYNPTCMRDIVRVLSCVCKSCGKILIPTDKLKYDGFERFTQQKRLEEIEKYCTKDLSCTKDFENEENVIPCGKNYIYITGDIAKKCKITYRIENDKKSTKTDYIMTPETAFSILDKISDEDAKLLGFTNNSHPRNMIMFGIIVPPNITRPMVYDGTPDSDDKLTIAFSNLMKIINNEKKLKDDDGTLNETICSEINMIMTGNPGENAEKTKFNEINSIKDRMKGKKGIIRAHLMGKRNNFCGRTVAGPDPSLEFGQVRIPIIWKTFLLKNEKVTDINREYLQNLLEKKEITSVISNLIPVVLRKNKNYQLKIGDQIQRYLQENDIIVVNRQPTLHASSMMGYRVKFGQELTIGLHLSYTSPMNCDFDGDENNAWDPQNYEVEAEVENVMNVKNMLLSSENNRPTMGMVMNSISGSYLLSGDEVIDDKLFEYSLKIMKNKDSIPTLFHRLKKYGVSSNSGRALISAMLPENFYYNHHNVTILEGILIFGRLSKSTVGTSDRSIIQEMTKNYGFLRTSDFFTDLPRIVNRWLIERGFSVGIGDVIKIETDPLTGKLLDKNKIVLERALAKLNLDIEVLGGKSSDPYKEILREKKINKLTSEFTTNLGVELAKNTITEDNSIGVMVDQKDKKTGLNKGSGTKGSLMNVSQIMGAVGQQFYTGERLKPSITEGTRILPMYDPNDLNPEAYGFIPQSFYTGLTPSGLFFLQMGAREGMLDTNLKTSDTGAAQRDMTKALENIVIAYDGSLRNTTGSLFSPSFNSGFAVNKMVKSEYREKKNLTVPFDMKAKIFEINSKRNWILKKYKNVIEENKSKEIIDDSYISSVSFDKPKKQENMIYPEGTLEPKLKITKYEKARIIGTRATQLANNDVPLIKTNSVKFIDIATQEYEAGILPIFVIRKFSDGSFTEIYPTKENI